MRAAACGSELHRRERRALLHDRRTDAGARARVNADDVEQLVVEVLGRALSRPALSAPRPRARKEIIVPGGHNSSPRRLNHALVLAIARAKSWMRELRSGRYADTTTIARQFQLNDAHVRRILRFGYLAPDIVEAIIEGRQPRSMTVKRLLQGIPCVWSDQRAA